MPAATDCIPAPVDDGKEEALIYTIGHSNHDADKFLALLAKYNITALVDVRSIPSSGRFPQFKKRSLEDLCARRQIAYRHCPELGNKVDGIAHLLRQPEGQAALQELIIAAHDRQSGATAYMCAEADWRDCHRQVIAQKLQQDFAVTSTHILRDGRTELHPPTHVLPSYYGLVPLGDTPGLQLTAHFSPQDVCCADRTGNLSAAGDASHQFPEPPMADSAAPKTRRWGKKAT